MTLYCTLLRTASMLLNLMCNTVVPIAESIALKFRIGNCDCPGIPPSPDIELRGKVRKGKARKCEENGRVRSRSRHGNEVKRLKLVVDVIVRQRETEDQEVEVREIARYEDPPEKKDGIFVRMFNIPSSIILSVTSRLRRWAHDLDSFENKSCNVCENNRIKKSPKRRISSRNYRKIIPFFPFNLLGFSNYSAFQMPTLTHCGNGPSEMNNLNVSTVSERCKRRRCSSTDESETSESDNDFSDLEVVPADIPNEGARGHDEVDSDESAETVTKQVTSSSNSSNKEGSPAKEVKTFLQELDEAANEEYNSEEDPEYKPEHLDSSSDSYNTDSVSEESYLASSRHEEGENSHASITSAVEATNRSKRKSIANLQIPVSLNGQNGHNTKNGTNGHKENGHEENEPDYVLAAGCEDDFKTPEESEHEASLVKNNF